MDSQLIQTSHKRAKTEEMQENSKSKQAKTEETFCEKENIVKSSWIKPLAGKEPANDKTILRDNNNSANNRITDHGNDADSTGRLDHVSSKQSKRSSPLSLIDSQNMSKLSLHNQGASGSLMHVKQEVNEHPSILGNELSHEMNLFSEQSINEV